MPERFYECPNGHITINLEMPKGSTTSYSISDIMKSRESKQVRTLTCSTCSLLAEEVLLSSSQARMARNFEPSTLFVNAEGDVKAFGRSDPNHLPKETRELLEKSGYKQTTISSMREYEAFQKSQYSKLKAQRDLFLHEANQQYHQQLEEQIHQLEAGGIVNGVRVPPLSEMHPEVRKMAEIAIENARNHRIQRPVNMPYIDAYENDNPYYVDRDTDWKRRH